MNKELLELDKAFRDLQNSVVVLGRALATLETNDGLREMREKQSASRIAELETHLEAEITRADNACARAALSDKRERKAILRAELAEANANELEDEIDMIKDSRL